MKARKKIVNALLVSSMIVSGQAAAHWSSGPFLYNDVGSNPMGLANSNLALGVQNNGTGANGPGTYGTNSATGTTYGTYTQTRATTGDYGWIQGLDPVLWANSHDMKGLAFSLANTSIVTFTINTLGTAESTVQTQATNGTGITNLSGIDWTPAFSLFKGIATQASHEGGVGNPTLDNNLPGYAVWSPYAADNPVSNLTVANYNNSPVAKGSGLGSGTIDPVPGNYAGTSADGTWGAYRSNADWTAGRDVIPTAKFANGNLIGGDITLGGDNVRVLDYLDQAQGVQGSHTVTGTFTLGPGDYSVWVGGTNATNAAQQLANYQALAAHIAAGGTAIDATAIGLSNAISDLRASYGFTIQTNVAAAVPVPAAFWLFGSALLSAIGLKRKV